MRLTEGGALRQADGSWAFVCPAMWGSVPETPFGRSHDGIARLHGAWDLVQIGSDGASTAQGVPELAALELVDVARGTDRSWALRRVTGGAQVWRVDVPEQVWSTDATASSIAADDRLFVAEVDGARLDVVELAPDGAELARTTWDDAVDYTPGLRLADGRLWLAKRRVGDHALVSDEGAVVAMSADEIMGPVSGGVVAVDSLLFRIEGDGIVSAGETEFVSCLEDTPAGPVTCVFPDLYALQADGTPGEVLFAMDEIGPPLWAAVPAAVASDCDAEWRRLANDLGLELELPEVGAPALEVPESSGCGGGRSAVGLGVLLLVGIRRLRR
ncbi:MAG: hypothetical protein ACI8PZ_003147 [Myxococcota bacterium]